MRDTHFRLRRGAVNREGPYVARLTRVAKVAKSVGHELASPAVRPKRVSWLEAPTGFVVSSLDVRPPNSSSGSDYTIEETA